MTSLFENFIEGAARATIGVLAVTGFGVWMLFLLGVTNLGDFRLCYGPVGSCKMIAGSKQ
jgi:hypothetical protein